MHPAGRGATALLDVSRFNESDATDPRYTFGAVRHTGRKGHLELNGDGNLPLKLLGQPVRRIDYARMRADYASDCVYAMQRHFTVRTAHRRG